ncbi:hypothetical protein FQN60_013929 [Etheostoma spectabile]|uniref:Uncharacterized protein n=1 Tax=Etheostoma spectabile TaxID=54343 RepID=A0A5J5CLJ3_9PERO|nr:hypothetical protein FQN60_013929 [Etheostoma spectabile]
MYYLSLITTGHEVTQHENETSEIGGQRQAFHQQSASGESDYCCPKSVKEKLHHQRMTLRQPVWSRRAKIQKHVRPNIYIIDFKTY